MRLVVDPGIYSIDAVKKAAYRLLHKFSVQISQSPTEIVCETTFAANISQADRDSAVAEFWAELLDQDLRERIGKETAAIRNAVLAVAFAPISSRGEQ